MSRSHYTKLQRRFGRVLTDCERYYMEGALRSGAHVAKAVNDKVSAQRSAPLLASVGQGKMASGGGARSRERAAFEREIEILLSTPDRGQERETAEGLRRKLRFLSFLPHFTEVKGKDVPLTPAVMDPGFYDGPTGYKMTDQPKLRDCLTEVMKKKEFRGMKVALVDLTKDVGQPQLIAHLPKEQVFAASVPKIAPMLAAFQLCHDLRVARDQKKAKTLDELFDLVRDDWAGTQHDPGGKATPFTRGVSLRGRLVLVPSGKVALGEPKAPRLENVIAPAPAGGAVKIEFRSTGEDKAKLREIIEGFNEPAEARKKLKEARRKGNGSGIKDAQKRLAEAEKKFPEFKKKLEALGFLERMRVMMGGQVPASNFATSTIVHDLGYLYIASTLLQSGLYDTNRKGGLWLGADYWRTEWRGPLAGGSSQSATAGSLAAFMTLLMQNRLVNAPASVEMQALMKKEPNPTHPGIVSWFKEGLLDLQNQGSLKTVLSKLGVVSKVYDCAFIEREVDTGKGIKVLRYVAVGLEAGKKDQLKALILDLDKCILANNGLTPQQGGHP